MFTMYIILCPIHPLVSDQENYMHLSINIYDMNIDLGKRASLLHHVAPFA